MYQLIKTKTVAVANYSGAMEADTISKHGEIECPKSRENYIILIKI